MKLAVILVFVLWIGFIKLAVILFFAVVYGLDWNRLDWKGVGEGGGTFSG